MANSVEDFFNTINEKLWKDNMSEEANRLFTNLMDELEENREEIIQGVIEDVNRIEKIKIEDQENFDYSNFKKWLNKYVRETMQNYLDENSEVLIESKDHIIRKMRNLSDQEKETLIQHFKKYPHSEKEINWNRADLLTFDDFKDVLNKVSKTQKNKRFKLSGISGLQENEDYMVFPSNKFVGYIPLNYESSKLIASNRIGGCEGKWCTAYQKTNKYWENYVFNKGIILIYIVYESTKYAIAYLNNKVEIFDAQDNNLTEEEFVNLTGINIKNEILSKGLLFKKAKKLINKQEYEKYKEVLLGKIPVKNKKQLLELITKFKDLSKLDVTRVRNMSSLFRNSEFNGNISEWDVSNVNNMNNMFNTSKFNGDISKWDVSNVKDMNEMFNVSIFNGDISEWDVSSVKDMSFMFHDSKFNGDISKWDVSNVKDMNNMFRFSIFNGDISEWDVSNVENMRYMFSVSKFNGDISKWDVSNVKDMDEMFNDSLKNNLPYWYKG